MNRKKYKEQQLLKEVRLTEKLTIEEAMKLLSVSESTVRRIFARLESEGEVIRSYGCIRLNKANEKSIGGYSFDRIQKENISEKSRIGKAAVKLIESGDVIYLDSGTTVMQICIELAKEFDRAGLTGEQSALRDVKVFTNSISNLNILKDKLSVNVLGGEFRDSRQDFCGYITEESLKTLNFTKCFIGADGFTCDGILTATDFFTARINDIVTKRSKIRILLADHTKYNKCATVSYADAEILDCIVTDELPPEAIEKLKEKNVRVILS